MLSGAKGSFPYLGEPKGGLLLVEEGGPMRMGVPRASLGVSPPRMAEGLRDILAKRLWLL